MLVSFPGVRTVVTFFIRDVVGKKYIYIYTNLNKKEKTLSIILSTQRFKNCFHRIAGNEYLFESD